MKKATLKELNANYAIKGNRFKMKTKNTLTYDEILSRQLVLNRVSLEHIITKIMRNVQRKFISDKEVSYFFGLDSIYDPKLNFGIEIASKRLNFFALINLTDSKGGLIVNRLSKWPRYQFRVNKRQIRLCKN